MEFLFAAANAPFTISLLVMIGLGLVELCGVGLSSVEIDLPVFHDGGALDWLKIGDVPLLITLISFLTLFGISGLVIQQFTGGIPLLFAVPLSLVPTIPLWGVTNLFLLRYMPIEETFVFSLDEMVGKRAKLLGTAKPDQAVKAIFNDPYGTRHYVLVQAKENTLKEGDECILWKREGNVFIGIPTFENGGLNFND